MNIEIILKRLDKAINDLDNSDFISLFPTIIEDLSYILINLKSDEKQLSPGEHFKYGPDILNRVTTYMAKLSKIYWKLIYDVDLVIEKSDDYALTMARGGYNFNTDKMYYTEFGTLFSNSRISFLFTCMHEGRHKVQNDSFKSLDILSYPPYMLLLAKESVLEDSLPDNNGKFYKDNYYDLYYENDAEHFAVTEMKVFLDNLYSKYIEMVNSKGIRIPEELELKKELVKKYFLTELLKEQTSQFNDAVVEEINGDKEITGSYIFNEGKQDKLIMMDKYIKSHPELQEKYPIFSLLFKGYEIKSYEDIVRDKELLKAGKSKEVQDRVESIYHYVIETDPILALTDRIVKGKGVKEYLNRHPSLADEYREELQVIAVKYNNEELSNLLSKALI